MIPVSNISFRLLSLALPASIPWDVWSPYFSGAVILVIGLIVIQRESRHRLGLDKAIALCPLFLAVPLAVFGTEHFTAAKFIARLVPSWIPGHLFWVLCVGTCLISAALSIMLRIYAWLSAGLFALMLLIFEMLIHIPNIVGSGGTRLFWAIALRDLAFSGGVLAFAATQTEAWRTKGTHVATTLARFFIAIPIIFFGVEHLLHPEIAPGVPLAMLTPAWIPAHLLWSYLTGAVYVVTGLCLVLNKKTRLAATWLGLMIFLLVLAVYVPIMLTTPSDINTGLNYVADTLLLSGSALALAGAQRDKLATQSA